MPKLTFICGEMGSGKTACLINEVIGSKNGSTKEGQSNKIVVMKPDIDTKNDNKLLSRNGKECEVDYLISKTDDLFELVSKNYSDTTMLYVDEAQFLSREQADQLLRIATLLGIEVKAYGLRLNFNIGDENFAGATRLLQVAHEIIILKSKCDICGKDQAIFSVLFVGNKVAKDSPTILISDGRHEVNAKSVCPKCYFKSI